MLRHSQLGKDLDEIKANVRRMIKSGEITLGGNKRLRIYGYLTCTSGKKMKIENRVFFSSLKEAEDQGFRPCGFCMRSEYVIWKRSKETA